MLRSILAISPILVLCLIYAVADDSNQIQCLNKTLLAVTGNQDLPAELALVAGYSAVIRYSNIEAAITSRIAEFNYTDGLALKIEREAVDESFIIRNGTILHYNDSDCSAVKLEALDNVYNLTEPLKKFFNTSGHTFNEILSAILATKYDRSLFLNEIKEIDGLDTVSWLGCQNVSENVTGDQPLVQIRVQFVGAKDNHYYSKISPSVLASIEFVVYKVDNGTATIEDKYSLNVVTLEKSVESRKEELLRPPRGTFCSGLPSVKLPARLPLKFEATIEYVDSEKQLTDNAELMYDGDNRIISFALNLAADTDIPYVQSDQPPSGDTRVRVYQDFNYGFEYILSKDGRVCRKVQPIQTTWADIEVIEGKLNIRDPTHAFFNISDEAVEYAGRVREAGALYDMFVSRKEINETTDYIVVELLFTVPEWKLENGGQSVIHSIIQYHKNASHHEQKRTHIRFSNFRNNTLIGTSWSRHSVFPCLNDGVSDNFFYLKVADATIEQLQKYGFENVESALAEGVAKTSNVSVLRVSQFLLKSIDKQLLACFILGERNNGTPAPTQYLIPEQTTDEVRKTLNETLLTKQMSVSVVTDELKSVNVSINGMGVVSTNDEPSQTVINGYTGGSMFILAVFAFIFGSLAAIGGYIFYTKRQGIRGIAYQVFE